MAGVYYDPPGLTFAQARTQLVQDVDHWASLRARRDGDVYATAIASFVQAEHQRYAHGDVKKIVADLKRERGWTEDKHGRLHPSLASRDPSRLRRFKAWHKKAMAEKREDFRAMTHNVGTLGKAVATGTVFEAIRSGKLQTVRTPIGGFRLGASTKTKAKKRVPRRPSRDKDACPPTKRSSYPVPIDVEAAAESARPTSRTGLRPAGPRFGARPPATGHASRARYVRDVVLLMGSGHGLSAPAALRLIAKWNRPIDAAWRAGKTACWTADHVVKYDSQRMCPCESTGRDCARCATKARRR